MYPAPKPAPLPERARGKLLLVEGIARRRIHAYHLPAQPNLPTVVIFHGNAEQLAEQADFAEDFADSGLGVFAVEYPGYGPSSEYRMSEKAVYEDAESALLHLESQLGVRRESLVLFGRSLGTGVAVEMATRGYGRRLILVSPFTSMTDMAARTLPILPTRWLVLDRFDNWGKAPNVRQSTLLVHGARDSTVPTTMGRRLAERIGKTTLRIVAGADHNDILYVGGRSLWTQIVQFALGEDGDGVPSVKPH